MNQNVRIKKIIEELDPQVFDEKKSLKVSNVVYLGMGWTHTNYLVTVNGRKVIFRISLLKGNRFASGLKRAKEHIANEYNNAKNVQKLGITPKAYYEDISCSKINKPFLIIEYIEGKPVKRLGRKDVIALALLLAKLHSIDMIPKMRRSNFRKTFLTWNRQRVNRIANDKEYSHFTNDSFKRALKNAYEEASKIKFMKIKPSIIHNDPAGENLLRTKDGIKLIDWEGVALGPPQYDITTVIDKEDLKAGKLRLFLSTYKRNVKRKDALLQLREYQIQRCLQKLCIALSEAFKLKLEKQDAIKHLPLAYHIKNAQYEFRRCKELGIFPIKSRLIIKL